MRTTNKITIMSFILMALYGSPSFAATQDLIFSSQPVAHTMTTNSAQVLKYTVTNTSNRSIKIDNIDVDPHVNPHYWTTKNDCQDVIGAGQSCHVTLSLFAPSDPGFMNTALIINYGQPSTLLRSRPIQFDVLATPVVAPATTYKKTTTAAVSAKPAPTNTTYPKTTVTTQPVNKSSSNNVAAATTSQPQATPAMIVTSSQSKAMVPLANAQDAYNTSGAQINVYAGWSSTVTNKSNIVFNQYETDSLVGNNQGTSFIPGLGVSYDFVLNPNGQGFYLIQGLGLGVDFFNDNFERTGQVYQYELPEFNNYKYKAKLNSARLILNGEVDLHPIWHFVFFAEGGVGGAYNYIKYNESPEPGINGGELHMPGSLSMNWAYDIGGGVKLPIGSDLELSFRYLYTNPGYAETGLVSDEDISIEKPIKVNMRSNSWLFGLSYLIR